MNERYGVIAISDKLIIDFLKEHFELPEDIQFTDAKHDGFRRIIQIAATSKDESFFIMSEAATIPVVDLKPKIKTP